jgi:hypothetical protein
MKKIIVITCFALLYASNCLGADRSIIMSISPEEAFLGGTIRIECIGNGGWSLPLKSAKIVIKNSDNDRILRDSMNIEQNIASYEFLIPADEPEGDWNFACVMRDSSARVKLTEQFLVSDVPPVEPPDVDPPDGGYIDGTVAAHNTITEYNGPATCITCHQQEAEEMLNSLHMQWSGPTPDLTNTNGEPLGKAKGGINTFCTYAMSSKGACFSCHVRGDGNAPHPPEENDVDCLMCHSDNYQRKFVSDPENSLDVTNILGESKSYVFGLVDDLGNYTTVPDFDKMAPGTSMANLARTVHMPTNASCLRCHAKAGGGDWTKRGDMGMSSINPSVDEDVHLSSDGANISCVNCHSALNHKISGRGIDLRQTEAPRPTCEACHESTPHESSTLNRHAQGQVGCQVCHIREYAKGGATEMSRDWYNPVWNQAFCSGQGGFVGEEDKQSNVKPEYVWFDGTSSVYNIGETIEPDERGIYPMAKAHGSAFDGSSSIVPIKRHSTNIPLHDETGTIIPPAIMWMFMTGDFDRAVQEGMQEQGMSGSYSIVEADAEMLITHGVEPKENAPSCVECHDGSGMTPDTAGMLPFTALGYHNIASDVQSCTLCHEQKNLPWETMHQKHRADDVSCISCHSGEPTGFIQSQSQLCSSCHERKSWKEEGHKKHLEKGFECASCHTFS